MSGFAVIDLETTGFAYNHTDRVCDLRLLVDGAGTFETARATARSMHRSWSL